jgi:hypothetical protein
MIAYVYKWTDSSNGMWYYGAHNGGSAAYIGSGTAFNEAYKERPEAFEREVIYTGSYEDCVELESFILNELDAAKDSMSYNLKNTSPICKSEEMRAKVSATRKLQVGTKAPRSRGLITNGLTGDTYTSTRDAAAELGYSKSYIQSMLTGLKFNKFELTYER